MKIGIFTGTFDPFTIGHQNIAERALPMFDKLVIAVAVSKLKHASEEISKRVEDIKADPGLPNNEDRICSPPQGC